MVIIDIIIGVILPLDEWHKVEQHKEGLLKLQNSGGSVKRFGAFRGIIFSMYLMYLN